jgi:hypothetical protein
MLLESMRRSAQGSCRGSEGMLEGRRPDEWLWSDTVFMDGSR